MRKLSILMLSALIVAGCGLAGRSLERVNPQVRLDPSKSYTVVYWETELPWVLDPQGEFRPAVEELVAQFCNENPGIGVEMRWLPWTQAEAELAKALNEGVPPDVWGDWQGLARRNHPLQIAAGLWTDPELLTPAGRRAVTQEGQIWAWPRWTWPRGLLTLTGNLRASEEVWTAGWDWQEFGQWLENNQLKLEVNDWWGEFSCQALVAAAGYGGPNWGGQEVHEVFAALEQLKRRGVVISGGEYNKITQGKIVIGGFTPAYITWLAENYDSELALLPLPGVSHTSAIPVSSACLLQFRQLKYKGDDHSLASAMLAEFMVRKQSLELARDLWAAPAWNCSDWIPDSQGFSAVLMDSMTWGVPLYQVDAVGRKREAEFREQLSPVLEDFWAGKADYLEVAAWLEDLQ